MVAWRPVLSARAEGPRTPHSPFYYYKGTQIRRFFQELSEAKLWFSHSAAWRGNVRFGAETPGNPRKPRGNPCPRAAETPRKFNVALHMTCKDVIQKHFKVALHMTCTDALQRMALVIGCEAAW